MIYRLTAAVTHTDPTVGYRILAIVVGVWLLGYPIACAIWPYRRCLICKGTARRNALWGGKAFRPCGWCSGTGRRLRFGRWVFNHLLRIKKASQ